MKQSKKNKLKAIHPKMILSKNNEKLKIVIPVKEIKKSKMRLVNSLGLNLPEEDFQNLSMCIMDDTIVINNDTKHGEFEAMLTPVHIIPAKQMKYEEVDLTSLEIFETGYIELSDGKRLNIMCVPRAGSKNEKAYFTVPEGLCLSDAIPQPEHPEWRYQNRRIQYSKVKVMKGVIPC